MKITDEDSFIEEAARVFGAGMPPMAGRMWAYLAICEPPEQTAAMIAERLQASRGSVSGMARLLEQIGLIRRRTQAGRSARVLRHSAGRAASADGGRVVRLRQNRQMAEAGLALIADRPPESQARLRDIRDLYASSRRMAGDPRPLARTQDPRPMPPPSASVNERK